jgi:cell wall-associated NlpC family hydrolase
VVRETLEWVGTPYHPRARLKGLQGGVDCALLVAAVMENAGAVKHIDVRRYVGDEHLHSAEEEYLATVLRHAREIERDTVGPGDFLLWKFGRRLSHAAIVTEWPRVVHATRLERKVWVCDLSQDLRYQPELARYFSPF